MSFNCKLLLLALTGVISAVFWQEINALYHPVQIPGRFSLIPTADDASYLLPAENFLQSGIWTDGTDGITQYFQRPPGYGIIYLFTKFLFNEYALFALKIIQVTCFFVSVLLIGKISSTIVNSKMIGLVTAAIFAIFPMFSGFLYYTLTEAITPFFVLLLVYSCTSDKKQGINWLFIFSVSFLLLIRPQILPLILVLLIFEFRKKNHKSIYFTLIAIIPFTLWQFRTFVISSEWHGMHPIYSYQNNHLYRPGHEAITDLFRIWEHDGSRFHSFIHELEVNDKPDFTEITREYIPDDMIGYILPMLVKYKTILNNNHLYLADKNSKEKKFVRQCNALTKKMKMKFFLRNYLFTPAKSAVYQLNKSHLNLPLFQKTLRGNSFIELLRIICVSIIFGGFISVIFEFFRLRYDINFFLCLGFLLYFAYLVFIQRMNEERYITPFLPVLLLQGMNTLNGFYLKIRHRFS